MACQQYRKFCNISMNPQYEPPASTAAPSSKKNGTLYLMTASKDRSPVLPKGYRDFTVA